MSSVTLTCMVNPTPSSSVTYRWNTAGCYTNSKFTGSNPQCFPHGRTAQRVNGNNLNAEDAGTITCTAIINGVDYTSEPFTLRISSEQLLYSEYHVLYIVNNACYYYLLHANVVLYTSCYGLYMELFSS